MNAHSENIQLTDQEQLKVRSVARAAGMQCSDPGFSRVSKSAQDHRRKHGDLNGWTYRGQSVSAEFARIDRTAAAERRAVLEAAGFKPRYATKAEVQHVMRTAHNACVLNEGRPSASAMLRDAGVPAKTANKLASRGSIHTEEVWRELDNHPVRVAMREHRVTSRRKERGAVSGSLAGTVAALYSLAEHTKDRQRLSAFEAELAELREFRVATEQRLAVVESGEHWHAIALRMKADGATIAAIAKATGQKPDTVKKYIQRNR